MHPKNPCGAAALLGFAALVVLGLHPTAQADPIGGSWSGAAASVSFGQQAPSQQAATAQASAGGSLNINYEGSPTDNPPQYFQSIVTGNVAATAGGDPAHLLQVTASSSAPDPGTLGYSSGTSGLGGAQASWTNDAAIVTAPDGSSLPDTIRLNFTLTFSDPHGIGPYASLAATYDGTPLSYWGSDIAPALSLPAGTPNMGLHSDAGNASAVDSSTVTYNGDWATKITDTFHIDLPLNKSGVSSPFSLGLRLAPYVRLYSNSNVDYSGLTASIALTSVTLPNGTPLSALGDSVSFASGLTPPTAAPEPASLAVWGLVATAGGIAAFRRRGSAGRSR